MRFFFCINGLIVLKKIPDITVCEFLGCLSTILAETR